MFVAMRSLVQCACQVTGSSEPETCHAFGRYFVQVGLYHRIDRHGMHYIPAAKYRYRVHSFQP
jgi:hypothetical protein